MAQAKTRACAEKAGMGSGSALHIISEPEAAAMYALDAMDPHNIKVGGECSNVPTSQFLSFLEYLHKTQIHQSYTETRKANPGLLKRHLRAC